MKPYLSTTSCSGKVSSSAPHIEANYLVSQDSLHMHIICYGYIICACYMHDICTIYAYYMLRMHRCAESQRNLHQRNNLRFFKFKKMFAVNSLLLPFWPGGSFLSMSSSPLSLAVSSALLSLNSPPALPNSRGSLVS